LDEILERQLQYHKGMLAKKQEEDISTHKKFLKSSTIYLSFSINNIIFFFPSTHFKII